MRAFLLILSSFGVVLFGSIFAMSFANPLLIERAAREVIRFEIERRVGERIDSLTDSRIVGLARHALRKTDADIEDTRRAIRSELPKRVANVMANMLNADCECRKRVVKQAEEGEEARLSSLIQVRERIAGLVESAYVSVANNLLHELRVFSASNGVAFALLGIVTLMRRRATLQLALPGIVLVGAVLVTGGIYLFGQNWIHTIVFADYVGIAYAFYLGGVALLLADVVFNRANVTTRIVNLILEVVGSSTVATPC